MHTHTYAPPLCQRQTHQVHTVWLPMWCSSLSSISLDKKGNELFWERTVTLCWLVSFRDVSNSNCDLWPPPRPRGVQLSHLVVVSNHICVSLCAFAWVHLTVWVFQCVYLCFACVVVWEQTKQDALCRSQIYNSGTRRRMNTLVSVADERDEQRRGVMWLLLILPGNYSAIYYQRERAGWWRSGMGGRERRYHI